MPWPTGPVIPRTFPPPPGWSTDGYRIKAPWVYDRGAWKTWVDGALRPGDGQAITVTAPSRDSVGYQQLLAAVEAANPTGEIAVITDNLPSHSSFSTRTWLAGHLRIRQVFIPVGTCWLNLQEAWWPSSPRRLGRAELRLLRRDHQDHPGHPSRVLQQGAHARPWVGPLITVTTLPTTSPHLRI